MNNHSGLGGSGGVTFLNNLNGSVNLVGVGGVNITPQENGNIEISSGSTPSNFTFSNPSGSVLIGTTGSAGLIILLVYMEVTTAGLTGSLAWDLTYTDDNGLQTFGINSCSLSSTVSTISPPIYFRSNAGQSVNVVVTPSGVTGSPIYTMYVTALEVG